MTTSQSIQWSPSWRTAPRACIIQQCHAYDFNDLLFHLPYTGPYARYFPLRRCAGVQGRKVVESWRGRLYRCCPHCRRRYVCCAWLVSGPFSRLVVRFGWLDGGSELAGEGMNYPAWLILPYTLFFFGIQSMPYISEPHSWVDRELTFSSACRLLSRLVRRLLIASSNNDIFSFWYQYLSSIYLHL